MFKIGQRVYIKDSGEGYSNYTQWADKYMPIGYSFKGSGRIKDDTIAIVVSKAPHLDFGSIIYGIVPEDGSNQMYIIDEAGLSEVPWYIDEAGLPEVPWYKLLTREQLIAVIRAYDARLLTGNRSGESLISFVQNYAREVVNGAS